MEVKINIGRESGYEPENLEYVLNGMERLLKAGGIYCFGTGEIYEKEVKVLADPLVLNGRIVCSWSFYDSERVPDIIIRENSIYPEYDTDAESYIKVITALGVLAARLLYPGSSLSFIDEKETLVASDIYAGWINKCLGTELENPVNEKFIEPVETAVFLRDANPFGEPSEKELRERKDYFNKRVSELGLPDDTMDTIGNFIQKQKGFDYSFEPYAIRCYCPGNKIRLTDETKQAIGVFKSAYENCLKKDDSDGSLKGIVLSVFSRLEEYGIPAYFEEDVLLGLLKINRESRAAWKTLSDLLSCFYREGDEEMMEAGSEYIQSFVSLLNNKALRAETLGF